jgi:hypothetical protein
VADGKVAEMTVRSGLVAVLALGMITTGWSQPLFGLGPQGGDGSDRTFEITPASEDFGPRIHGYVMLVEPDGDAAVAGPDAPAAAPRSEGQMRVTFYVAKRLAPDPVRSRPFTFRPPCGEPVQVALDLAGEAPAAEGQVDGFYWVYDGLVRGEALRGPGAKDTGRGYTVVATTGNGDADIFEQSLKALGGRGGLPTHRVFASSPQAPGSAGLEPSPAECGVGGALAAGGATAVPWESSDDLGARGVVHFRQAASWIYYSGHYQFLSGGTAGGTKIHPSTFETDWEGVDVVLFAACHAVDIRWKDTDPDADPDSLLPSTEAATVPGAGVDGRAWWERFRGTLLGYRQSAPSAAAPGITRNFLRAAARLGDPDADPEAYSVALAKAWMDVNHRAQATYATAVDRRGDYHRIYKGRRQVIPYDVWRRGNDAIAFRAGALNDFAAGLADELMEGDEYRRPPTEAAMLASRTYAGFESTALEFFRADAPDEAAARAALQGALREWLAYRRHVFYETDLRIRPRTWARQFARANGRVPTAAEILAYYTPDASDRSSLPGLELPTREQIASAQASAAKVVESSRGGEAE